MDKHDFKNTLRLISIFLISGLLLILVFQFKYLLPESYVKEYQLDSQTKESFEGIKTIPCIKVIVENGVDYHIFLPYTYTFEQAIIIIEKLNKNN